MKWLSRYVLKRLEAPHKQYEQRIINNMESMKNHIRPGDVLLVEGRSSLSRVIGFLTKSPWSHAALYVGDYPLPEGQVTSDENNSSSISSHMLIEANTTLGVHAIPLHTYQDHNIRICRPFGISSDDLKSVIEEVHTNLGNQYDHQNITDLALMLMPRLISPIRKKSSTTCIGGCTDYQVICSGMIARAFQNVGYPIVPLLEENEHNMQEVNNPYGASLIMRHYSQIIPRDFDLSPNFEIIKYNIVSLGSFDYKSVWAKAPARSTQV